MGRAKPYKVAHLDRLVLGALCRWRCPWAWVLVAPAATAATSACMPEVSTIAQCFPDLVLAGVAAEAANHDVHQPLTKYTLIGQVKDVAALKSSLPEFNDSNIKVEQGEWVFATNYKIGTLSKLADLRNIQ